jgi:hypothetical protein
MATATAQFTKEEIVKIGKELYERDIKPLVEAGNKGRVVAIDMRTGQFELADDAITSASQLRARVPEAVIFVIRVGYPALHRILLVVKPNQKGYDLNVHVVVGGRVTIELFSSTQSPIT